MKPKEFYFILGYHIVSNCFTLEIYNFGLRLACLPSQDSIPASSFLVLLVKGVVSVVGSILVGLFIGLVTVLLSRLTRQSKDCVYYEPFIIIFGILFTYLTCRVFILQRFLGGMVCGLAQQRYMFVNFNPDSVSAVKIGAKALGKELFNFIHLYSIS